MEPQVKIKFTLAFIFMGWMMLLFMPRLPEEQPASSAELIVYAIINIALMVQVHRWVKSIGN